MIIFRGQVDFESTGSDSDRLVQVMDQLYEISLNPEGMAAGPIQFTAISLQGDPRDLWAGPVKIKLFIESEDEERYGELYTNIDMQDGTLEVREKDVSYRKSVIRALSSREHAQQKE